MTLGDATLDDLKTYPQVFRDERDEMRRHSSLWWTLRLRL
jgi:hypothetical protein